jgi:signal transduction histidine kinase
MFVYVLFFFSLLALTSVGSTIVNKYYSKEIIDSENQEFVDLYIHLKQFSSDEAALTYASHYSHTTNIEMKITGNDVILYETLNLENTFESYEIESSGNNYNFSIDHSISNTHLLRSKEIYIINIIAVILFTILIFIFVLSRRARNKKTIHDIKTIQDLIEGNTYSNKTFFYEEFKQIFDNILVNQKTIELLNQKKTDNLNGLVHDLKTPITIIKFHLEEEENSFENKDAIIQSLNDLSQIATDLVAEKFQGEKQTIDISKILSQELKKYETTFLSKNIILQSVILEGIKAQFNKRDFIRVIQNLLTNAYYYSYNDTVVYVNLIHNQNSYSLEIINKGEVLTKESLKYIFNKKDTDNTDKQSNGLGLYITKLLVEDSDATISALSNELGNHFIITIPKVSE